MIPAGTAVAAVLPPESESEDAARPAPRGASGELLVRLAAGDGAAAMRELYARYGSRLYGLGLRLLGDGSLAEDLVQETFVRLWRSAPSFDAARGSETTFVFMLARRVAIDLTRRRAVRPRTAGTEAGVDDATLAASVSADEYDAILLGIDVREGMRELSPSHREVLELSFDDDLSQREVADRLGIPVGTVKSRVHHGLRALRRVLEEKGFR